MGVAIVLISITFLGIVLWDGVQGVTAMNDSLEDKSKNCLAEYNLQSCDPLNLSRPCQVLVDCFQLKDRPGMWPTLMHAFSIFIREAVSKLPLPAVLVGGLLLRQLIDAMRNYGRDGHQ